MNRHRTYKFTIKKYTTDDTSYLKDNINYEYLSFYTDKQTLYGCIRFFNQKREHIVTHLMRNAKVVPMKLTEYNSYKTKIREKTGLEEYTNVRQTKDDIIEMQQQLLRQKDEIINEFKLSEEEQIKKITEICMNLVKNLPPPPAQTVKQKFNLNFFLNEQCKDAINIIDFVKGIHLDMKDFLLYGKLGYSEAISHIFKKEMEKIDLTKRPLHCTDLKREILYVRNNNQWQNDETKEITDQAIETLSNRNYVQMVRWKEENPDYTSSPEKYNDYLMLTKELIGGCSNHEQETNLKRIIKNIASFTLINKGKDL
jgi:hypothetical protein